MQKNAGLQTSEGFPSQLADKVVPVMEVNPKLLRIAEICKSTGGSTSPITVYTTPTDTDFYITGATFNCVQDVTSDNIGSSLNITVNGVSVKPLYFSALATTAGQFQNQTTSFNPPIKVDKGTTITVSHSGTAGITRLAVCIYGYNVYNPKV